MKNPAEFYAHSEEDRFLLEKLNDFLPERIVDAHAHLYSTKIRPETAAVNDEYGTADAKRFLKDAKLLYGDRNVRAVFLPWPTTSLRESNVRERVNDWIVSQLETAPDCGVEVYVMPGDSVADIEAMLVHPGICGFKPYYMTAEGDAGGESDIESFLPESVWQVANKRGMCITLHMMKKLSPADPVNLSYILEKTKKYPNAKLILAHCGRGFAAWTILETARKFKGIPNIYYDMAAICEPAPMFEVIRQAGADHVMWGTDYPLAQLRSRPFSSGSGSFWLGKAGNPSMPCALMGLESMFAFYQAVQMLDLSKQDVEDIFYNNAVRIFGLDNK